MDSSKQAEILSKRKKKHIAWLNVCRTGHPLTTDEARHLERLGYGELHGGANGVFWLYPIGEGEPEATRTELMEHIGAVLDESLSGIETKNPLEAVTQFTETLDSRIRRRVGDDLEKQGRNRYTGEPAVTGEQQRMEGW